MAKLKMKKIEIVALMTDSKKIVERLQRRGVVELFNCEDAELVKVNTESSISTFDKCVSTAVTAKELLDSYAPAKKSIDAMLGVRREIEKHKFGEIKKRTDEYLRMCYDLTAQGKNIADRRAVIARNEVLIDQLLVWKDLDIPQQYTGTKHTSCFIGTLPGQLTESDLEASLARTAPELDGVYSEVVSSRAEQTCAVIMCCISDREKTLAALRELGFSQLADPTKHPPIVRITRYQKEIKAAKDEIKAAEEKIKSYAGRQPDIEFLIDYYTMRKDKYEALNYVGLTKRTMIIQGYIPEKCTDALVKELEGRFSVAITVTEPSEDEDVPVALGNNGFVQPVEGITEMYALPNKRDVDPSPVMAFFYYLFFGLMLSDAGYGLVMVLATALILTKTKVEGTLRRSLKMFMYCGVSTVFWGALFGSWFGDIIPVIAQNYFHKTITTSQLALWFEPMKDPVKLLLFSFLLGIIHLFVGVAVNCVQLIKQHKIFDAIFDTIPTYMMIVGVAPYGAGILTEVNPVLKQYGLYVAVVGMAIFVLTSSRASRNPIARLGGGLYALYNFASGWLGDILSYSRLLALGLATGSIAGVINMMAVMPSNMVLKTVLLIIVFPIGHTLNIAINLLGAYVHTARLQFVELFSKFYEGGGRPFTPLKVNTKYVKFKEEN